MTGSPSAPRIALATAREVPDLLDAEGVLLRDALRAQGLRCEAAVWDDPNDLLPAEQGPLVLEVELAEPSLFLDRAPEAVGRLVSAVVARLPEAR